MCSVVPIEYVKLIITHDWSDISGNQPSVKYTDSVFWCIWRCARVYFPSRVPDVDRRVVRGRSVLAGSGVLCPVSVCVRGCCL